MAFKNMITKFCLISALFCGLASKNLRSDEFLSGVDVAHFAVEGAHRSYQYYIYNLFIKKHVKYILKQTIKDYKTFLDLLDEDEILQEQQIRDYLKDKHTFVGFNMSKKEWGNFLGFALAKCGGSAADFGLHNAIRKLSEPGRIEEEMCSINFIRFYDTKVSLCARIYYGIKAEGWEYISRFLLFALPLGSIRLFSEGQSFNVKLCCYFALIALVSVISIKDFNNLCRNTWIEHAIKHSGELRDLLRTYAQAREDRKKQEVVEVVGQLKKFVEKGHKAIPGFRKWIN